MSDPIRDVVGDEAKAVLLQFMGQEFSELHKIGRNITNSTPTLQGMTIDVQNVINSVAPTHHASPPPAQLPGPVQMLAPQPQPQVIQVPATPQPPPDSNDPEQFEFDFKYDVAKDIAEKLECIDSRLKKIEQHLASLTIPASRRYSKKT